LEGSGSLSTRVKERKETEFPYPVLRTQKVERREGEIQHDGKGRNQPVRKLFEGKEEENLGENRRAGGSSRPGDERATLSRLRGNRKKSAKKPIKKNQLFEEKK